MSIPILPPELAKQMHDTMHVTGQTEEAYLLEAIRLYEWAAYQLQYGRSIAAVDNFDGTVTKHELQSLQQIVRIAEDLDKQMPNDEELIRRHNEAGIPVDEVMAEMRKLLEKADDRTRLPVFTGGTRSIGELV